MTRKPDTLKDAMQDEAARARSPLDRRALPAAIGAETTRSSGGLPYIGMRTRGDELQFLWGGDRDQGQPPMIDRSVNVVFLAHRLCWVTSEGQTLRNWSEGSRKLCHALVYLCSGEDLTGPWILVAKGYQANELVGVIRAMDSGQCGPHVRYCYLANLAGGEPKLVGTAQQSAICPVELVGWSPVSDSDLEQLILPELQSGKPEGWAAEWTV